MNPAFIVLGALAAGVIVSFGPNSKVAGAITSFLALVATALAVLVLVLSH